MDPLLLIGSGSQLYREFALQTLAAQYPIVLLNDKPNTWQAPYLLDFAQVALIDREAVLAKVSELKERYPFQGVLTYDEAFVEEHALVAELLQLPANSPQTAHLCRDKHLMRRAWEKADVPSARSILVRSLGEAHEAAARIGYPVILKPRGLAASVGVMRVETVDELATGYEVASINPHPSYRAAGSGILVEEYLDGPEISVESAVVAGQLQIVAVTRKLVGLAPGFEELGHIVAPGEPLPEEAAIRIVLEAAHQALGVRMGVTHAELRLTRQGPRMIELGLRCAGDLIPAVVKLATGVDLCLAAANMACNQQPEIQPAPQTAAAIGFLYPSYDARLLAISVQAAASELPWLKQVTFLAQPGTEFHLPPRGFLSRLGFAIVTGSTASECQERINQAKKLIEISLERLPLPESSLSPRVAPRA